MLPFPHAHWFVGFFLIVTFAAFAPSYFIVLPDAPWVHHLHGITATLWIVLLMTQNVTAHRRRWRWHAAAGMASLVLVPLFTVGGLLVTQNTLLKDTLFRELFGEALSSADFVVSVAFVLLYVKALQYRRNPAIHARYMLSTVILLLGPSIARFFAAYVPGFLVRSLETLPKFGAALDASFVIATGLCLYLIVKDYRDNQPVWPFVSALIATVAMLLSYYTIGYTATYSSVAAKFAALPAGQIAAFGAITSSLAVLWAWRHPYPRKSERRTQDIVAGAASDHG